MDPTQVFRNVWAAHWVRSSFASRRAPASSRRRTPAPRARSTCLSSSARPCPTQTSACASRKTWCTAHLSIPHIASHPHPHAHTLTSLTPRTPEFRLYSSFHTESTGPYPHPHPPNTHRTPSYRHPHPHTHPNLHSHSLALIHSPPPPQDKLTLLTGRASYVNLTLDDLEAIPQATNSTRRFENPFAAPSSPVLLAMSPAKINSEKQVS